MTELNSESGPAQKEIARFNSALSAPRPVRHLNQKDLARRWSMSPKTLERWRWLGDGPPYLKIGGKVLYRIEDVEAFEKDGFILPAERKRSEGLR